MEPSTSVLLARLELELVEVVRRLDALDALAVRILAEQRAHRARMAAAVEVVRRRNGHEAPA